jgi:uncharacterized NAD(P)/FAD-binding protein YdhS
VTHKKGAQFPGKETQWRERDTPGNFSEWLSHASAHRKEIHRLKQLLAEKTLEVDFFRGALQKVEARRQKRGETGETASTSRSEK